MYPFILKILEEKLLLISSSPGLILNEYISLDPRARVMVLVPRKKKKRRGLPEEKGRSI